MSEARRLYDRFDMPIAQAHCRAAKIRDTGLTHDQYRDLCYQEAAYVYQELAEVMGIERERPPAPDAAARLGEIADDIRSAVAAAMAEDGQPIEPFDAADWCGRLDAIAASLAG